MHEVIGHGNLLADPRIAEVKRLAGEAARRCETPRALQYVADVFWFTIEFGVMWEEGELRCYGAGLLSSYGEIDEFRGAEIRPLDFHAMATLEYDITHYQPILFACDGMGELDRAAWAASSPSSTTTRRRGWRARAAAAGSHAGRRAGLGGRRVSAGRVPRRPQAVARDRAGRERFRATAAAARLRPASPRRRAGGA